MLVLRRKEKCKRIVQGDVERRQETELLRSPHVNFYSAMGGDCQTYVMKNKLSK
jgi:hypothetical protein